MTPTQSYWKGRPVMYRAFDEDDRLIYIGASKDLPQRFALHRVRSWWADLVARVQVQVFSTMDAAFAAEKAAIQEERPAFNVRHTGREGSGFSHWTSADVDACLAWQAVNGRRTELPQRHLSAVPA